MTPTPIDIDRLEIELTEHPDRDFVFKLVNGLRDVFFTGIDVPPTISFECPNNKSAKCQPDIVNNLIDAEVQKRYLVGPFQKPSLSTFRVSPLGVAEGTYSGKKHLIVDLSASPQQ